MKNNDNGGNVSQSNGAEGGIRTVNRKEEKRSMNKEKNRKKEGTKTHQGIGRRQDVHLEFK